VVIINKGKIAADSSIEDLKQSLGKESIIILAFRDIDFAAVQVVLSQVAGVAAVEKTESPDGILAVNVTCKTKDDIRNQIYAAVKKQDWLLLEFYQQFRSLENIFRELTREN
jgi:ABC-2 type transport system ATP-binding protein